MLCHLRERERERRERERENGKSQPIYIYFILYYIYLYIHIYQFVRNIAASPEHFGRKQEGLEKKEKAWLFKTRSGEGEGGVGEGACCLLHTTLFSGASTKPMILFEATMRACIAPLPAIYVK